MSRLMSAVGWSGLVGVLMLAAGTEAKAQRIEGYRGRPPVGIYPPPRPPGGGYVRPRPPGGGYYPPGGGYYRPRPPYGYYPSRPPFYGGGFGPGYGYGPGYGTGVIVTPPVVVQTPVIVQRYQIPSQYYGTAPGYLINYGGQQYLVGGDHTMTLYTAP